MSRYLEYRNASNQPCEFHSSGLTNLFSRGYVWLSVSKVLERSLPLDEYPRLENVLSCKTLNSEMS